MITIGGVRADELAAKYGTPLYAYDESALKKQAHDYVTLFKSDKFETGVLYASKAFCCKEMVRLIGAQGMHLDVVSGGELATAKAAGYDCSKIFFHGNNKSRKELEMAIEYGVGTIVVDNPMEAELLAECLKGTGKTMHTVIRINPGIEAHTHEFVVTAHVDSKFGVALAQEEEVIKTIRILEASENIVFDGLHAHIGSQIFDKQAFIEEIKKLYAFVKTLKENYGIEVNTLNYGGGFAVTYTKNDQPIPLPEVCECILKTSEEENAKIGGQIKRLFIEPGRSTAAEAGYMLFTIGFQKQTPNKLYAFVDGGMNDNIRPAIYGSEYDAVIAGKEEDKPVNTYCIAGKCCESGDILIQAIDLPKVETGDILVMKTCGAYEFAMSSRYNKIPRAAVVFAEDGESRVVVKRETYEDLLALEI